VSSPPALFLFALTLFGCENVRCVKSTCSRPDMQFVRDFDVWCSKISINHHFLWPQPRREAVPHVSVNVTIPPRLTRRLTHPIRLSPAPQARAVVLHVCATSHLSRVFSRTQTCDARTDCRNACVSARRRQTVRSLQSHCANKRLHIIHIAS
jgi:hypothetical protein